VDLNEFIRQIDGFGSWQFVDKIKLFTWFLHTHRQQSRFSGTDIRDCFIETGIAPPTSISPFLNDQVKKKPPQMLRDGGGFFLERSVREEFDRRYGQRAITVQVHATLRDLPSKLPDLEEREYLEEALRCFKAEAYRAAIVMCWNVAYDHLCDQIVKKHLSAFNAQMSIQFTKQKPPPVGTRDDFHEFNERRVLEVCRAAGILDKNVYAILDTSLDTRNRAAHASGSTFKQPQAENYILELINNAILKL
jgi:hypothetical protein